MNRRQLLRSAASAALVPEFLVGLPASLSAEVPKAPKSRVRPGNTHWPSVESWQSLNRRVGDRLNEVESPLDAFVGQPPSSSCEELFDKLGNPYLLGDDPALTQTLGWVGGWTSRPSVFAVAAEKTDDVVAAVNFAREHNLRLVVKGGGHSYQGTSSAPDSLLIWTRRMNAITVHDAFVAAGCDGVQAPQPAVSVEAGAIWAHVYDAVTTKAGRYVQGGGCLTVGVAGLVQSGGFGNFSKGYGTACASLLEAEIVTADGAVRIANACTNSDLFWAIKGGGGGSFGVVTRLTLRTHDLPEFVGGVFAEVTCRSDEAFRRLIERFMQFYADALFNPHWGEQVAFRPNNTLSIAMVFQGLEQQRAESVWRSFFDWLASESERYGFAVEPVIVALPARHFWDPNFLKGVGGLVLSDDRPGAPEGNIFWAGNRQEAGQVFHAYQSTWLPSSLLEYAGRTRLVDALFAASRHWSTSLHFNKGLAGAPEEAIAAAKDTAMNPAATDAFALAICGAEEPPAYPGIAGHEPDRSLARRQAEAVEIAMGQIRKVVPQIGSYGAEGDFFEEAWSDAFWGSSYARLANVKAKYDPEDLFIVHHGVGSERWSTDGFTKKK
ncbi:FAD-binding oxidoreductase [Aquibium sp. LZ166]|uniref:FAD-binding oxidoreductase n=1 Tax=Aquibium pacificus TaxID=3153579 RepID=A0ABV3SR39_9HYPH